MENRPNHPVHKFTVAVIGGGFTGTTLAAQLVRHTDASYSLIVIERTGLPGRGVAYGTECNSHLLNVPAKDMSAFPEDRGVWPLPWVPPERSGPGRREAAASMEKR